MAVTAGPAAALESDAAKLESDAAKTPPRRERRGGSGAMARERACNHCASGTWDASSYFTTARILLSICR